MTKGIRELNKGSGVSDSGSDRIISGDGGVSGGVVSVGVGGEQLHFLDLLPFAGSTLKTCC